MTFKLHIPWICLAMISLSLLLGCAGAGAPPTASQPTPNPGAATAEPSPSSLETLVEVAPTRTPEPTATPGAISETISAFVAQTGMSNQTFLGLEYDDWLNLGFSLLIVLIGYLIGVWLIRRLLPRLVRRTATTLDDRLLGVAGKQFIWLFVLVALSFAVNRLVFLPAGLKSFLNDTFFVLAVFLVVIALWRLIGLATELLGDRAHKAGYKEVADSLIRWSILVARLVLLLLALSILLAHFGINIAGIAILLGLIGIVLSLAARDLLTDLVAGAIILIDRPFLVGDRIDLTSINTVGDVVEIGMRSTRIITTDNRLVTIPNSQIGKNQVVNYTHPDPSFMVSTDIMVAYENDAEQVQQVIDGTVRATDGVLTDRNIDVQLREFSEYTMRFRVSWWIASYIDQYMMRDRVNRAIIEALKEAGVILPYDKSRLTVKVDTDQGVST
jgi:small-conductance mechanosensitive channel